MLAAVLSGATLGLLNMVHCASMCGPLSSAVSSHVGASGSGRYQVGRLLSYTFVGALSGHLGRVLQLLSPSTVSVWIVATLTAAACLLTARALLRATTEPTSLVQLRLQRKTDRKQRSAFSVLASLVPKDPLVFGLLSVLLPCGVLASALLAAVASGDAVRGAGLMATFAAVSGVAVLGASLATQLVPRRFAVGLRRTLAYALVALALLSVSRPIYALTSTPDTAAAHIVHCH